ncbi:MAG: hypothetical protein NT145_05195 [Elusimicrobia bacterium]|nr:hypothetical protein [Elusimicrobiota bacterium]
MNDFLNTAREIRENSSEKDCFNKVFDAIEKLRVVHYKSYLDLDNIESVFGAIEMGRLIGGIGNHKLEEIKEWDKSIRKVILKTLETSIKYPVRDKSAYPPKPYDEFTQLIMDIKSGSGNDDCSILTFNYDITIDYAFNYSGLPIDYCLSGQTNSSSLKLLKLHGSLNWGKCEKCESIVSWKISEFFSKYHWQLWSDTKYQTLDIGSRLKEHQHCNCPLSDEPFLVPPTWNKTERQNHLTNVWGQAARELSEAENIFIIGYSFPESDLFFKYLFALGTIGKAYIHRIWIFNPDSSNEVQERYKKLLGTGIRKQYRYELMTFEKAIPFIRNELKIRTNH